MNEKAGYSQVISKSRCPNCAKRGKDTRGDNLANYSDGHAYCFSCGWSSIPLHKRVQAVSERLPTQKENNGGSALAEQLKTFTNILPKRAVAYLHDAGIRDTELSILGIMYDENADAVVYPMFDSNRIVFVNLRYLAPKEGQPKARSYGFKPYTPLRVHAKGTTVILVEDFLSAIKVSRYAPCVPLFGTHIEREALFRLASEFQRCVWWLDSDKLRHSLKMAKRAFPIFPKGTGIIYTEADPKELLPETMVQVLRDEGVDIKV